MAAKRRKPFDPANSLIARILRGAALADGLAFHGAGPRAPGDGRSVERLLADSERGRATREKATMRADATREKVLSEALRLGARPLSDAAMARLIARRLRGRKTAGPSERTIREILRRLRPVLGARDVTPAPRAQKKAGRKATASARRGKPSRRR